MSDGLQGENISSFSIVLNKKEAFGGIIEQRSPQWESKGLLENTKKNAT